MLVSVKIYNNIFRHYNQTLGQCQQDEVTTPRYMHVLSRSLVSISFYGLNFRVTTQWTHTDHGSSQSYHGSSQLCHGIPWHTVTVERQRVSLLC